MSEKTDRPPPAPKGSPIARKEAETALRARWLVPIPWSPDPDTEPGTERYKVRVKVAEVDGVIRTVGVELTSNLDGGDPAAIDTDVLRKLAVVREYRRASKATQAADEIDAEHPLATTPPEVTEALTADAEKLRQARLKLVSEGRGGRGRGYPKAFYAEVATVFSQAVRLHQPALQAVRDHFAEVLGQEVTKDQAGAWVSRARKIPGIDIPPATRGRAAQRNRED